MSKRILMFLFGPLDTDGRVLRCLSVLERMKCPTTILTCGSNNDFSTDYIRHVDFQDDKTISYFHFVYRCLDYAKKHNSEFDAFYCQDYYSTLIGYFLAKTSRKKIIYDAHELLLPSKGQRISVRDKVFIFFERIFIRKAFYVIAANEERAKVIQEKYNLQRITWVLNITDAKMTDYNANVKVYSANSDYYLVYQGVLSEGRNLSFFIKALNVLPSNVKLMLIGGGNVSFYRDLVQTLNLNSRVIITGSVSNSEMLDKLKDCHLGIISYPFNSPNNIYCSPNKIFEYAALYLPMISTNQPFLEKNLKKYGIGVTFRENDVESFKSSFEEVISREMTSGMFDAFLNDYNFENEAKKIAMVINML